MPMTTTRKATAAVAALLITAGAGTATASALSGSSTAGDARPGANPVTGPAVDAIAPVTDTPIRPAPRYRAAERSTQKPTGRVLEMHRVLATRYPDLVGRPVRGLKAADGTQAWVVSGAKHTCLGADNSEGTGYSCRPNGEAQDGISVAERRQDGTQRTVALVPDEIGSVSASGSRVAAENNLVVAEHRTGAALQANPTDGRVPFRVGTE